MTTLMIFIVILLVELWAHENASCWSAIDHQNHCTFEERFSICNFFCGKSGSSGTELLVLRCVSHGTLLAFLCTPGCPNGAAAGIHAVAASNGQSALLVIIPQEAGFQADICQREQREAEESYSVFTAPSCQHCVRQSTIHSITCYILIDWNYFVTQTKPRPCDGCFCLIKIIFYLVADGLWKVSFQL